MEPKAALRIFKILFIIYLFIAGSFYFFSNREADPDLWGHLKFGQDIYQKRQIPRYDIYSYSFYGKRWIDHEWLSELIFLTIFKFTKGPGLIIFKVIIGLILIFLIFTSISGKTKGIFLKLLFMLLSLSVINYGFHIRPQIFTYLLFTLSIFLIDKFEETQKLSWLYPFPFISLFWCNLHGGFVAGIGVLILYFLFKLFQRGLKKGLVIVTLFTILATFINPYKIDLWVYLFKTLPQPKPYITEWQRIGFIDLYLGYFLLLGLSIIGIISSKVKRYGYEITCLFIAFLFSFQHNRHIVLFAILASIYIPKYIDSFAKDFFIKLEKKVSPIFLIIVLFFLSLYLFLAAPYKGKGGSLEIEIPEHIYPKDAFIFMKENKISGNIFPFFNWAQMCIWELSDNSRVFFDGRYTTVYSLDFIRDYFDILYGKRPYKDYLKRFPETDIMLLHRENPLTQILVNDRDWVLIYSSSLAWIFLKDNKTNSHTIENFKNNRLIYNRKGPSFYLR